VLLLASSSDLIRVITGSGSCIEPHVSWMDNDAGTITPGRTNTVVLGAGTGTVLAGPSAGQRNAKFISLNNVHASSSCTVRVEHYDGSISEVLADVTLLAGEALVLDERGTWTHYDANGGIYAGISGIATAGEMMGAVSLISAVTPGRQHLHPGHPKCWVKCGVTGNSLASYNISSVQDSGTGRCTPYIAADFYGSDWCCMATIERSSTALTVTNLKFVNIRATLQFSMSVQLECYDATAITAVVEDPTAWHMVGLGTLLE